MRVITWEELKDDFSSSIADLKWIEEAEQLIEGFLGAKPDGSMTNLSTLPILLANVLNVYSKENIVFDKVEHSTNKNFILKIKIVKH